MQTEGWQVGQKGESNMEFLIPFRQFSHSVMSNSFVTPWTTSAPGFPVHHQLLEIAQTHVHQVQIVSHPYMTTGKARALTRQTFVGKVMSLLFNMLSRLVIPFLPRSKHLLISLYLLLYFKGRHISLHNAPYGLYQS